MKITDEDAAELKENIYSSLSNLLIKRTERLTDIS